ncbi:MAG TPA: phosphate ABC transporter, permease protein PstA, partial [Opitutus sp.]|nr:phosphate ABC transporter, permease protein PstA [Opitutus sp.]
MNTPVANPFAPRSHRGRRLESLGVGIFRAATYAVLLFGFFVLGDIALKGSRTVFQTSFPFINVPFLTQAPESLYVFEHDGKKRELGDRAYREFRATEEAKARAENRPVPQFKAESYVYSAGGIWPCIVGTVLLVVGSMAIALALGVSSAIFLNEYAADGPVVR